MTTAARLASASRWLRLRLGLLNAFGFVGIGIYMPFFPLWLENRNLPPSAIGAILATPIIVRIVVTAPLVGLADRGFGLRPMIVAANLGLVLAYGSLHLAWDPLLIAALVAAMALAQAPIVPLTDLATLSAVRRHGRLDYGRLRMWGSIAFLCANVASGYALAAFEPDVVLALLIALAAGGAIAGLVALPPTPPAAPVWRATGKVGAGRFSPALWSLIGAAACIQSSHAALYAFGSLSWSRSGFSDTVIGYLWATGVAAEILVFAVLGRAIGQGRVALGLLALGGAAAAIRFVIMAAAPGLLPTFLFQVLHGLSFGATHLGAMAGISHLAPPERRGRAQGTLQGTQALAMACGTVLSGPIFSSFGSLVFLAMVPLAGAGLLLTLAAARRWPAQPHSAGEGG